MTLKNNVLYQQQLHVQSSRTAQIRILTDMTRDAGEKTASAVGGNHLSFSRILAMETEKQRRQQQGEMKKAQPL